MVLCGYPCNNGQACSFALPCPAHTDAYKEKQRKRKAQEEAVQEKRRLWEQLPKCGFQTRVGHPCTNAVPCEVHGVVEGMKDCSSTLDSDPRGFCRKKCKLGELFCDCHAPFPDMGRQAAIYADGCRRRAAKPSSEEFFQLHYPGRADPPAIHDISKYSECMRAKLAA